MNSILSGYLSCVYTTVDNVILETSGEYILLSYFDVEDKILVSNDFTRITLRSRLLDSPYECEDSDICIDSYVMQIINYCTHNNIYSLCDDEVDDAVESEHLDFCKFDVDRITSDLSVVVISKLMYENSLIGYRFRLNNGCLDISIDKGKELGIVPYKIGKRVQLSAINGVLASNYECKNKVLFPDISNDDTLCKKLLESVLSQ